MNETALNTRTRLQTTPVTTAQAIRIVTESAAGAVLKVQRIELSEAVRQGLTTTITSIGTAATQQPALPPL